MLFLRKKFNVNIGTSHLLNYSLVEHIVSLSLCSISSITLWTNDQKQYILNMIKPERRIQSLDYHLNEINKISKTNRTRENAR